MFDRCLVKKAESHVSSSSSSSSSFFSSFLGAASAAPPAAGAAAAGPAAPTPDPSLKSLSEESWPVGLKVNSSSLEDGGDLVRSDGDVIISEDESSVDTGHFSGHDDSAQVSHGLSSTKRTRHKNSLVEVNQAIL